MIASFSKALTMVGLLAFVAACTPVSGITAQNSTGNLQQAYSTSGIVVPPAYNRSIISSNNF